MKIVFLGSSELSVIPLKEIINAGHQITAVVCQPDKPNTRGNKIEISPLKKFAISQNIPVYQFNKIRDEGLEVLNNIDADLLVVVYYGQILSQEIIDMFKYGTINLHPSLLPKYRGPSPVITPILNGDTETGVTIMRIEQAIDSGNILAQEKVMISKNETAGELWERLTLLGSKLMVEVISKIERGEIQEEEQKHSEATFTRMFSKSDAKIDFCKTAEQIVNQIRAFNPNPIAYFEYKGERFRCHKAEALTINNSDTECGSILNSSVQKGLQIKTINGVINIQKLQAPNGKVLDIKNFLNGRSFEVGYVIK